MVQFEPLAGDIRNMGAQLVFIAAEKRQGLHKPVRFLVAHPVSFPFLLDEDRRVTKAYGLYHRLGLDAIHIAHPATLVIDAGGVIRYLYRGDNQGDRAPMEQVLTAAGNVNASRRE